jgi:hypothetical protein
MAQARSNNVLNRLLILHHRSMATYVKDARPWTRAGEIDDARELLESIVAEQSRTVDDVGKLLNERNHTINYGEYPLSFTALNDLAFSYLLKRLTMAQHKTIAEITTYVDQLKDDPQGHVLAQRALGAAKAHLEMLEGAQKVSRPSAA